MISFQAVLVDGNDKEWSSKVSMWLMILSRGGDEKERKMNRGNFRFQCSTKEAIGLIYNISLKEGKRYYISLVLTQIPVAMSFEDMGIVDRLLHISNKQAERAMGILKKLRELDESDP